MKTLIIFLLAMFACGSALADGIEDATNYRQHGDLLASAGQPTAEQLEDAAAQGFQRIVALGFSDGRGALVEEGSIARRNGMQFLQLPVTWSKPEVSDFRAFAAFMQAEPEAKTLVHCQLNYRGSAFMFLYRVIVLEVDMESAWQDMVDVWTPNDTWRQFIDDSLTAYGRSFDCESCVG